MPKNVGDLGKLIVAKGFKSCPKCKKSPNLVTLVPITIEKDDRTKRRVWAWLLTVAVDRLYSGGLYAVD